MAMRHFPTTGKIFGKVMRDSVILRKFTKSSEDTWGAMQGTWTDYNIRVLAQIMTQEDFAYMLPGILAPGDLSVFALPEYTIKDETISIALTDRITYSSQEYEIRHISDVLDGDTIIGKEIVARRLII
jgi:hypothetical protein